MCSRRRSTPIFTTRTGAAFAQQLVAHRVESLHTTLDRYAPVFDEAVGVNAKSLIILMVLAFALIPPLVFYRSHRSFGTHLVFSLHLYTFLLLLFCVALADCRHQRMVRRRRIGLATNGPRLIDRAAADLRCVSVRGGGCGLRHEARRADCPGRVAGVRRRLPGARLSVRVVADYFVYDLKTRASDRSVLLWMSYLRLDLSQNSNLERGTLLYPQRDVLRRVEVRERIAAQHEKARLIAGLRPPTRRSGKSVSAQVVDHMRSSSALLNTSSCADARSRSSTSRCTRRCPRAASRRRRATGEGLRSALRATPRRSVPDWAFRSARGSYDGDAALGRQPRVRGVDVRRLRLRPAGAR